MTYPGLIADSHRGAAGALLGSSSWRAVVSIRLRTLKQQTTRELRHLAGDRRVHPSWRTRNMVEHKAKIEDFHRKLKENGQFGSSTLIRTPDKITGS
jgi:hypothetical protein